MLKKLSFAFALAGIAGVALLVLQLKKPMPAPVPLVEPSRAPYSDSIGARGMVESVDENVRIAPLVPGVIAEVYVRVGDHVRKGQPLFRGDTRDAESKVLAQQAQVGLLQAKVGEAEVMLADRQDSFQRTDRLRTKDVMSEDDRQRRYYALRSAETALASARADLDLAKAQLAQAEVNLDLLNRSRPA